MSVMTNIGVRDRATSVLNRIRTATSRVNRTFDETGNSINRAERRAVSLGSTVTRVFSSISAAYVLNQIKNISDEYTNTNSRIALMNDGLQTTKQLQKDIMASANRSRAAYDLTADSISKMGIMAKDAFKDNKELIAFTELINKQFRIAGTSSAGKDAAMLQLTQAMGAGVLRGEELNSIFEQAPTIIQTIADYLNVPIGQIRTMAAEGQITASIVKNAMLSSADEINKKFNSLSLTYSEVGNLVKNNLLKITMPLIQVIGKGAQFLYNNWDTLAPVFYAVGAAALFLAVGLNAHTVAATAAAFATQLFTTTLLGCPLGWIALAIGVIVGVMYKWIQSVGGVEVAWLKLKYGAATAIEAIKLTVFGAYVSLANTWGNICMTFETAKVAIQNSVANMGQGVLNTLQNMANGAINIINKFIGALNKIEGVSISPIEQLTFATKQQALTNAQNAARNEGLASYKAQTAAAQAERNAALSEMQRAINRNRAFRENEIAAAKANSDATSNVLDLASGSFDIGKVGSVGSVGSIDSEVNIAEEDLRFMRDVAEMKYVQNFVTLTPTVAMDAKISEKVDVNDVVREIERKLEEEFVASAEGVYA